MPTSKAWAVRDGNSVDLFFGKPKPHRETWNTPFGNSGFDWEREPEGIVAVGLCYNDWHKFTKIKVPLSKAVQVRVTITEVKE